VLYGLFGVGLLVDKLVFYVVRLSTFKLIFNIMNSLNKLFTRPDADRGHFEQHGILSKWVKDRVVSPIRILLLAALVTVAAATLKNSADSVDTPDHRPTPGLVGASGSGDGADEAVEIVRNKTYPIRLGDTPWMFVADFLGEDPTSVRVLNMISELKIKHPLFVPENLQIGGSFTLMQFSDGSVDMEYATRDQIGN